MSTVYQHPDGHSVDFTDNTLTVQSSEGACVAIPMGVGGLRELANDFAESENGNCPECGHAGQILNVGREHYGVCHEHKVSWHIGSNLFSGWQDEKPTEWYENKALLSTYRHVEGSKK